MDKKIAFDSVYEYLSQHIECCVTDKCKMDEDLVYTMLSTLNYLCTSEADRECVLLLIEQIVKL